MKAYRIDYRAKGSVTWMTWRVWMTVCYKDMTTAIAHRLVDEGYESRVVEV